MDFISRLWPAQPEGPTALVITITTTVVTTAALLSLARYTLSPPRPKSYPSPLHTVIPRLSGAELQALPYTPDYFPGARDVPTPYGAMRVYEWGPETGPKVLMVHGISTSCQTLTRIAHPLVAKGCRVLLFDLFGRGFSDGVGDLPHDERLYVTQVLLALASSPLAWTGTGAIHLVGYSMGGGVAAHFAAAFPHLVASLVLLAPAGLIRAANFGAASRFLFTAGLVPEALLAALTKRRLQTPIASSVKKSANEVNGKAGKPGQGSGGANGLASSDTTSSIVSAAVTEAADPPAGEAVTPLEERVMEYVRWMLSHHPGFVPAFMSCIRYAPLVGQEEAFRKLALREPGTTAVVLGRDDTVINPDDYAEDALPLVGGEDNVVWRVVPGGHDFPMTHSPEVLEIIYGLWGLK